MKREPHDRIAVFQVSADNASAIAETAKVAGAAWVLLGDEILVSGRPTDVERTIAEIVNAVVPRVHTTVASERLQLVTQNGRLFQQEQPDTPVIVDKGRYLVVDLDPGEAKKTQRPGQRGPVGDRAGDERPSGGPRSVPYPLWW